MPSATDLANFNAMRQGGNGSLPLLPPRAALPDDVKQRFPSLKDWEDADQSWFEQLQVVLQNLADQIASLTPTGAGSIVLSPNGTRWQVVVDDSGNLTAVAV